MTAYTSTQAHSSIEKAMTVAGLGRENLRTVDVDAKFALRPERLEAAIVADLQSGARPCFVVATVGTTSSGAVDPLVAIGEICRRHGLWLHVDAASYGTAALCPEFRSLFQGLELADSYCFNPHKWMFVNFDCDCFFVADRAALIRTLSVLPEYLKNKATESGAVIDYRDWHIPLGRRFRALKLWFVIRHYGVEGLRAKVRDHVAMAQQFARWVDEHPLFERMAPTPLNLVSFRHVAGDAASQTILERINQSGRMYLTHTRLNNQFVIRMSIGQTNTQLQHVRQAWELICEAARAI
jgi:aromatic-L-amino-acid decarboxylase